MRAVVTLCLIAVACAQNTGYNYQPEAGPESGLANASEAIEAGAGNEALAPSFAAPAQDSSQVPADAASTYSAPAELDKEFYTFEADDSEFDDPNAAQRIASTVKQDLRVVFIKGPENKGLEDAALALAKQAAQQTTAIYVLNKQADIGALADKLNAASKNANNRPEVHFVKYRTPEDAQNAQRAIQSQYDTLPGNAQNINGGVAPVINFASQGPARAASAPQTPQATYLPSSVLRRLRFRL